MLAWSRPRVEAPEEFDEKPLGPRQVARYLYDLEKVNRFLLGAEAVLAHVRPRLAASRQKPYRILDLGCGGGDHLRHAVRYARTQKRTCTGVGVDRNCYALAYACTRAREFAELSWVCGDIFALPFPPRSFDLVMSNSVLHHLAPAEAVRFVRQAGLLARDAVVISDLTRSELAVLGFRAFAHLAGLGPGTRRDGVVSVRRSYRPEELAAFAREAGLSDWQVHRHPLYRMTLVGRLEHAHEA